jgi:cyclic pyranopterin phosphate synthase
MDETSGRERIGGIKSKQYDEHRRMKKKLSHIDGKGKANMVDVTGKEITVRTAEAYAEVKVSKEVFDAVKNNEVSKGDVLSIAKFAGIQAAKKTSELIPLCHNIFISKIDVELKLNRKKKTIEIKSFAKTNAQTGIEMEALTAVSIAALTVYDMCKAIDKSTVIGEIKLLSKTGGKSGNFIRSK